MAINGGFTLGDKSAREMGLLMLRPSQRPVLPDTVDRTLAIPGRNGAWDFGADIGARSFNLECSLIKRRSSDLQEAVSILAAHLVDLYGKPRTLELIFDYQPDRIYYVRYSGNLPIDRVVGVGQFTLPLVAFDPFAYSSMESDDLILDSDFLLDSEIRLDDTWEFTIRGAGVHELNHWGSQATSPEIIVTGSFATLSITANGKTFRYNTAISNKTLNINGERMTVKLNGANAMMGMSGDFINLLPDINEVTIGGTGLNCSVSFIYRPKFI